MCGRFVDPNLQSAGIDASWLKLDPFSGWTVRFNVKPTQDVVLITPNNEPRIARWWFIPSWHVGSVSDWKATTFNARIEDAADKPTFRPAWKNGRCLLPMRGYYEWSGEKGDRQPSFIQSAGNEELLFCAGLASRWNDLLTVTMMTRAANESVKGIHHRMPVILNTDERDIWLSGERAVSDLGQNVQLIHHRVNRILRDDDGPDLIEPAV